LSRRTCPRSPASSSITSPATTNRVPAKKTGGTLATPTFMASQVAPQIRHISANKPTIDTSSV
jgi:hypothetical protein